MPASADFIPKGGKLGFDPWLHTPGEIKDLGEKLAGKLRSFPRPISSTRSGSIGLPRRVTPVEFLGHNRAGRTPDDKLEELRKTLAAEDADVVVLTLPESINWLFNMRGRDVPNVPVVLGFALVPEDRQADAVRPQAQDHARAQARASAASPRWPTSTR